MLNEKEAATVFVWEPNGGRLAMIHAENPGLTKVDVSFYDDLNKKATLDPCTAGKKGSKRRRTPERLLRKSRSWRHWRVGSATACSGVRRGVILS